MSNRELHVAPRPCSTCPYRRDTPSGIWDETEYEKLRVYDDDFNPTLVVFLCHQSKATGVDTACKGWLAVHPDHPSVRLALATGQLTREQVEADCPVEVYSCGNEAADAGEVAIKSPSVKARREVAKLIERGVGRE